MINYATIEAEFIYSRSRGNRNSNLSEYLTRSAENDKVEEDEEEILLDDSFDYNRLKLSSGDKGLIVIESSKFLVL